MLAPGNTRFSCAFFRIDLGRIDTSLAEAHHILQRLLNIVQAVLISWLRDAGHELRLTNILFALLYFAIILAEIDAVSHNSLEFLGNVTIAVFLHRHCELARGYLR